jgi:hypothetical protein
MHRFAFTVTNLSTRPGWFREESSGPAHCFTLFCGLRQLAFTCQVLASSRVGPCHGEMLHIPANLSQRCMPLFNSQLAGSADAASATPDGPLSARASCPPSLSCPVWAGRIAARQVNGGPGALARPAILTRRSAGHRV